ncbi:Uncharacterised protein r2_g3589 [Pycnogonum litorale]
MKEIINDHYTATSFILIRKYTFILHRIIKVCIVFMISVKVSQQASASTSNNTCAKTFGNYSKSIPKQVRRMCVHVL